MLKLDILMIQWIPVVLELWLVGVNSDAVTASACSWREDEGCQVGQML